MSDRPGALVRPTDFTVPPAAKAFIGAFDGIRNFETIRSMEMASGRDGIIDLHKQIRVWIGALERDVSGFESGQLIGDPSMPDHVLGDAKRVLQLVTERRETLPYADVLIEKVGGALTVAQKEWTEAQDMLATRQGLLATARVLAVAVQKELVAFRYTLRELLGPSHRDYQMLRSRRFTSLTPDAVEEVEPVSTDDAQPVSVAPAPTPTNGHAKASLSGVFSA